MVGDNRILDNALADAEALHNAKDDALAHAGAFDNVFDNAYANASAFHNAFDNASVDAAVLENSGRIPNPDFGSFWPTPVAKTEIPKVR